MPDHRVAVLMPIAHEAKCRMTLPMWVERGYEVVVIQDKYRFPVPDGVHLIPPKRDSYPGWPKSINELVKVCGKETSDFMGGPADLFIAAGDDMHPDPKLTAQQMAEKYFSRFPSGEGVMQPTGDDWTDSLGRIAERICGSPVFGRVWATQAYGGQGPLCPEYHNFYADEELLNVAKGAGLLWQDRETSHYHDHWSRRGDPRTATELHTQDWWAEDKATFERRRAAGFPNAVIPHPEDFAGVRHSQS